MTAIWQKSEPDYVLVDTVWESLVLSSSNFAVLPAISEFDEIKTFESPDNEFSFRVPGEWAILPSGESSLIITNPDDPNGFLLTVDRRTRGNLELTSAVDEAHSMLRYGFKEFKTEGKIPIAIEGAIEGAILSGSLRFNDNTAGRFQSLVVVTRNDVYFLNAIFESSKSETLASIFNEVFRSFEILEP